MQKYLKISNQADQVSRISLEKLGLSTKRNNPNTIGKFGSGIKFAPIAALRNDWDWIFTGSDSDGDYTLKYEVVDEGGIPCIQYNYGDYTKSSSFTIDAGTLSWTEAFQIYREAISNAMDEAKENDSWWSVSLVDDYFHEPGVFSVFISAAPELMAIYKDHDLYFSSKRTKLYTTPSGFSMLSKIDNVTRIYSHDVLVFSKDTINSIFDYQIDDIELNEERAIKSEYTANMFIEAVVCNTNAQECIEKIIDSACSGLQFYEFENINFAYLGGYNFAGYWKNYFSKKYGSDYVIIDKATNALNIESTLLLNGLKPVLIKYDSAFKLLKSAGIPTVLDRLGESVKYKIDDSIVNYPNLSHAISLARLAEPGLSHYADAIGVFSCETNDILGLTINMKEEEAKRRILVSKDHAERGSVVNLIGTLLHEYDHASSGIGDAFDTVGRTFRELADLRIGKLIADNYQENPFTITDGLICFNAKSINQVGFPLTYSYEYSELMHGYIVKTAEMTFFAYMLSTSKSVNHMGERGHSIPFAMSNNGETFFFEEIPNVEEVKIV